MAISIFSLVGSIFVDSSEAEESISRTERNSNKLADSFINGISTAGKWAAGIATAAAGAAVAIGGAFVSAAENTREYRNEMAKLETAFQTAGHTSEAAKQTYGELNAILGDTGQATEAANHLAQLCETEEELQKWTDICTGVYATFGDSIPIEGLAEAANETAKVGTLTGSLADALNWAGVNEEEFQASLDKCNTEQERQALITETLTGLYDEASSTFKETNADIIEANKAQEAMNATMAEIGALAEPVISMFMNMFAEMLTNYMPMIQSLAETLLPLLMDVVNAVLPMLISFLDTLMPVFMQIIEAILPVFIELMNTLLPPVMQIVQMLLPVLMQLITALLPLLQPIIDLLNPIIQACMAVITPLLQLLSVVLPPLIAIITMLVDVVLFRLQTAFQTVADIIQNVVNVAVSYVKGQIDILMSIFSSIIDFIRNVFTGNWRAAFENVKSIVKSIFEGMVNVVKAPINVIIGIINGLISGITSGVNGVIGALNKLKIDVPEWVTDLTGVSTFGFNLPTVSAAQIPYLADGGNVSAPGAAVVGEAGVELLDLPQGARVTPLTQNGDPIGYKAMAEKLDTMIVLLTAILKKEGVVHIGEEAFVNYVNKSLGALI
ncbi:MAG: hypothetical protein ABS949_14740 [Solibacillus sp.]